MKRFPLIAGSAVLGLAAGFGISALRQPAGSASSDSTASGSAKAAAASDNTAAGNASRPGPGGRPPGGSGLTDKLRTDLSLTHGVTRWLVWMTAVEKAGPNDYAQLARMAKDLPGALNMLGARWIDRDPAGLFELCKDPAQAGSGFPGNELGQLLMENWPKKDPDAVLAALKNSTGLGMGLQYSAMNALFETRPEQTLILMSDLGIQSYSPDVSGVRKWAEADPQHAAEVALAHPSGYASQTAMEMIGKVWAEKDPAAALSFSATQDNVLSSRLADQVMRQWVEKDIDKASAWLSSATDADRGRLLPSFIEAWGKKDAPNALQWCLTNTSGSQQTEVINRLVTGSAAQSVDAAGALVAGLEAGPLRAKAAVAFIEATVYKDNGWWPGFNSPNRTAKPEAIAWLGQLDADARKQVLSNLSWRWSEQDPKGFAEYLSTPDGQAAGPEALQAAGRNLVRDQPVEAMAWASKVPEDSRSLVLSETFQNWTRSQPDAAMDWLKKLPASDARREDLYLGAVQNAVPYEAFQNQAAGPGSPLDKSQRSLAKLLATDPAAARAAIGKLPLNDEQRTRVLTNLRLNASGGNS